MAKFSEPQKAHLRGPFASSPMATLNSSTLHPVVLVLFVVVVVVGSDTFRTASWPPVFPTTTREPKRAHLRSRPSNATAHQRGVDCQHWHPGHPDLGQMRLSSPLWSERPRSPTRTPTDQHPNTRTCSTTVAKRDEEMATSACTTREGSEHGFSGPFFHH